MWLYVCVYVCLCVCVLVCVCTGIICSDEGTRTPPNDGVEGVCVGVGVGAAVGDALSISEGSEGV